MSAAKPAAAKKTVAVCGCPGCAKRGAARGARGARARGRRHGLADHVEVAAGDCDGLCGIGPVVRVPAEGVIYQGLKPADAAKIVKEHLAGGAPVQRLCYAGPGAPETVVPESGHPFFKDQLFWVMRNRG